ncbi:hypothetical protein C8R45DRAFT_960623 [Mycena sanguinolenta]|nr:hypothetical protein C8R45DRAFT_960623 [Mycena sanguinolenta]
MGKIDLRREIRLHGHSGVTSLRKLHSAKINHGRSEVAVAVYQGDGAEQEWRRDVAKYMAVRHPNIIQLYGTASHAKIHAAVFNDDLIPLQRFLDFYRHSNFSTLYIHVYTAIEFQAVSRYMEVTFHHCLPDVDCTFFIRRSTRRFCVDLVPGGLKLPRYPQLDQLPTHQGLTCLDGADAEDTIIDSLALHHDRDICYWDFGASRSTSIATSATANIGSVFHWASGKIMVEVAFLHRTELRPCQWQVIGGEVMPSGWTRVAMEEVVETAQLTVALLHSVLWLSQANHIFTSLQVSSDFEDYVVLRQIDFTLTISAGEGARSTGFLFLCPPEDFRTGQSSFKWPGCPAYWSFDPSGTERLTSANAIHLGFPSFRLSVEIWGTSWDAAVYAGLHQFQEAKGFDPDSQYFAQHLGYPLYQMSYLSRFDIPFAHIHDEGSHNTRDEDNELDLRDKGATVIDHRE